MPRPTWPKENDDPWFTLAETGWNDISDRADLALSTASGQSATPGVVTLDSFAGSTDDAKLTNALSYAAAQTVKPPIAWGNRRYDHTQSNRQVFSGMKLVGLGGYGDQQRAANSIPNDIRYTGSGTWWQFPAGQTFDVQFQGLSFQGNSNAQFIAANPGVAWISVWRDLGFNLWKHVFGNPTTKFLHTACKIGMGFFNANNGYNTMGTFGGSDSEFFTEGALIDSPPSTMTAGAYHLIFDYTEKSGCGPIYMTAERSSGIRILGGQTTTGLVLNGMGRVEGRNVSQPCAGSNIRIDGAGVTIRDWWVAYGATALNTNAHTGEGGVITQTGGDVLYDGLWYDRATGVAETVPFIYVSGGVARVRNIRKGYKGGSWTGLPRVDQAGGTVDADNSVTVV
jgi:hypothetical protein